MAKQHPGTYGHLRTITRPTEPRGPGKEERPENVRKRGVDQLRRLGRPLPGAIRTSAKGARECGASRLWSARECLPAPADVPPAKEGTMLQMWKRWTLRPRMLVSKGPLHQLHGPARRYVPATRHHH